MARSFRRTWIDQSVEVNASAAELFDLFSDIDGWPRWVPGLPKLIRPMGKRGPVSEGSRFGMVLQMPPLPTIITPCRVFRLEENCMEWGGRVPGAVISHRFENVFLTHDQRWTAALVARFDA